MSDSGRATESECRGHRTRFSASRSRRIERSLAGSSPDQATILSLSGRRADYNNNPGVPRKVA